ncbi:MAG: peptidoglycan DD-metalloendopeptidase family protein, partial [Bdellovibrionales bacterium]
NVYRIAHDNKVPMRDLIVLNNLQPPFVVKPGQKLVLPAGRRSAGDMPMAEPMPAPSAASAGAVETSTLPPIELAPLPPVSKSETLYTNTPRPAGAVDKTTGAPSADVLTNPSPAVETATTAAPSQPEQKVAALTPGLAEPPPEAPSINFVWPIQGPVLSAYGPKGQGLNNDGVNIGAPKGAPVVAAASGIVVYAGNEMKGFGNLVLIRHQGGWVTAYAHLDRTLVNKDGVVAQGDMIGTVGKTGNVSTPQLHFEARYAGKPVDPGSVIKD